MQDSRAPQAGNPAVVGEAPREQREDSVVATQPVAAKAPRPVSESVDNLKVAEAHDDVATDVPGDVEDQQQPRPFRTPRGERRGSTG